METQPILRERYTLSPTDDEERAATRLAVLFYSVGLIQFLTVVYALIHVPFAEGIEKLSSSPWSVSALCDYTVGTLFTTLFIWTLNGSPILCVPIRIASLMFPFVGNFALLAYSAMLLMESKSATSAFLPATYSPPTSAPPCNRTRTSFIAFAFSGLLVWFLAVCWWALQTQPLSEGWHRLMADLWSTVTFVDNLSGLLFTASVVVLREGKGFSGTTAMWLIAFALLGNATTCVYVLLVVRQAWARNVSFESAILSKVNALR